MKKAKTARRHKAPAPLPRKRKPAVRRRKVQKQSATSPELLVRLATEKRSKAQQVAEPALDVIEVKEWSIKGWGEIGPDGCKYFNLHADQTAVIKSKARFTAAIAGTGGGKTAVGPVWVLKQIMRLLEERDCHAEPILGMVVAPTFPVLARATAPHLVRALAGTDLEGRFIPTSNRYELPDGLGTIWVLSADNPGGLEGGQFDFVWMDEAGQMKFDAWVAIQGRTGLKQAPVLITTTPYGQNWLFSTFYRRWQQGDPDYYVRQWSSHMNPAYPKAEYERMRKTLSPQRFAMRYDGSFVKRAGLVYPDLETCKVDWDTIPEGGELVGGIDFGWNDPFSGIAGVRYISDEGEDCLYVYYERYKRNTVLGQHALALPPGHKWWADPSRPDSINELKKAGHRVTGAYNNILVGVDAVNARIYNRRLFISSKCKALFAESQEYAYPEKDDETHGEKPIGGFDHALDALRYLVAGVDKLRVAESGQSKRRDAA